MLAVVRIFQNCK